MISESWLELPKTGQFDKFGKTTRLSDEQILMAGVKWQEAFLFLFLKGGALLNMHNFFSRHFAVVPGI